MQKKLAHGDGNFDTKKEMIGFLFDGVTRTVRLPAKKAKAYIKEAHKILRQKTVQLKSMQALVGKLRHALVILPAAKGFFTPINTALRGNPKVIGLGKSSEVRAALQDLITLPVSSARVLCTWMNLLLICRDMLDIMMRL